MAQVGTMELGGLTVEEILQHAIGIPNNGFIARCEAEENVEQVKVGFNGLFGSMFQRGHMVLT